MTIHLTRARTAASTDPTYQAFLLLRTVFAVAPIVFGLDKFANVLTDWPQYLAPWIDRIVPGTEEQAEDDVRVVEEMARVLGALVPRTWAWVVAAGLAGTILTLLPPRGFYDLAPPTFRLLVAAAAL